MGELRRSDSRSRHVRTVRGVRTWQRICATVVGLVTTLGPTTASQADPVVCATLKYQLLGSPMQTAVDNCWVPSPWNTQAGHGPRCDGDPASLRLCTGASVAVPMP